MFCKECGARTDESGLCPNCGTSNFSGAAAARTETAAAQTSPQTQSKNPGMSENIAGLLCYPLGWLTGIIFLIVDKRPFVKFHALQSILTFGALSILTVLLGNIFALLPYSLWSILRHISTLISIGSLILGIFLMVQAYQGKEYKLPLAGDIAQKHARGN